MINALGQPQHVLLLGGTSDIARAVTREWAAAGPLRVSLAARPGPRRDAAVSDIGSLGAEVFPIDFDALDTDGHPGVIAAAQRQGDIDVAVVGFGVLHDDDASWLDHDVAVSQARINFVGAVSVAVPLANLMRTQGHGVIVALSSVAGERVRRSNFSYGSGKAGMDGYYLGLGEALRGSGARVLVVRPGFVHSKMTEGRDPAPLSVTPDDVARAIVAGVAGGRELVWVPGPLRGVMSALRHVPRPLFRRLPL